MNLGETNLRDFFAGDESSPRLAVRDGMEQEPYEPRRCLQHRRSKGKASAQQKACGRTGRCLGSFRNRATLVPNKIRFFAACYQTEPPQFASACKQELQKFIFDFLLDER